MTIAYVTDEREDNIAILKLISLYCLFCILSAAGLRSMHIAYTVHPVYLGKMSSLSYTEMRIIASMASMLEEPRRVNEEPFWVQARYFMSNK